MIVPAYWAEARARGRTGGRQVTVRRFGWSDASVAEAQAMADTRAAEALARALAGEKFARREPKVPYNGAHGVPIREEIVARCADAVVTRNSYGARCLNTPNVLFADVDLESSPALGDLCATAAAFGVIAFAVGGFSGSRLLGGAVLFVALFAVLPVAAVFRRVRIRLAGGFEARARQQLAAFLATRPTWNVRLYRTPAGMRLLATHAPIDPRSGEARALFAAVGADVTYARMCVQQRCFRARLTAKPWRIGVASHMRPRPGVWPVAPERRAERGRWIEDYEAKAAAVAACVFVEAMGSGDVAASVAPIVEYHDRECRALEPGLVLA